MLEQFGKNTWAAIEWTLENSGSLTIRDMVYGFYKTPHGYFDIQADENGAKKARDLLKRHVKGYKVRPYADYFRKQVVNYYFSRKTEPTDSTTNVVHDALIQSVFFALDKAYGQQLTRWTTNPDILKFSVTIKDKFGRPKIRTQEPDALAIINDKHVYIELELTQKFSGRIDRILKRYKVALRRGAIPQDSRIYYITDTKHLARTMHGTALRLTVPPNVKFCTLKDFMADPKADIYCDSSVPIEVWAGAPVGV